MWNHNLRHWPCWLVPAAPSSCLLRCFLQLLLRRCTSATCWQLWRALQYCIACAAGKDGTASEPTKSTVYLLAVAPMNNPWLHGLHVLQLAEKLENMARQGSVKSELFFSVERVCVHPSHPILLHPIPPHPDPAVSLATRLKPQTK